MMNGTPRHDQDGHDTALRVIAVAPPEALRALRQEEDIELIRASDAVDALGELAHPLDDASPTRAAVLLQRGVLEPEELEGFEIGRASCRERV